MEDKLVDSFLIKIKVLGTGIIIERDAKSESTEIFNAYSKVNVCLISFPKCETTLQGFNWLFQYLSDNGGKQYHC